MPASALRQRFRLERRPPPPLIPGATAEPVVYNSGHGNSAWMIPVSAGLPVDDAHAAIVFLPFAADRSVPTPTVMALHGATATERNILTTPGAQAMLDSWIDLGWIVVSSREGSAVNPRTQRGDGGAWGNQFSRRGVVDAWEWAKSAWTPDPHGFLLFGWSMGGNGALNAAAEAESRHVPIAAVSIVDGATNLADNYTRVPKFRRHIAAAYGLPNSTVVGDSRWYAAIDAADGGHDPQRVVPRLRPFPLQIAASAADPTVRAATNSQLLFATLTPIWTAPLQYVPVRGGGHCAATHFRPTTVNPFFAAALTRR